MKGKNTFRKKLFYAICILITVLAIYNVWPEQKLASDKKIDFLLVNKSEKTMKAFCNGQLLKTYQISIGKNAIGHKVFEGDNKTPEGIYTINDRNPNSSYHKNLAISYPNTKDRATAKKIGRSPGGNIKIHGMPNGIFALVNKLHRGIGFTFGCIMVTNSEVDELYNAVVPNAKIEIRP